MKAKKLLAGVLAGTMVLGTGAVSTFALSTPAKVATKATEWTKLGDGKLDCGFFSGPFSDALELTDKAVTITFTSTASTDNAYDNAHYILYYSDDAKVYPGEEADLQKQHGTEEYTWVRADLFAYSGYYEAGHNWGWNDAAKDYIWSDGTEDVNTKLTSTLKMSAVECGWGENKTYDEWAAENKTGLKGQITASKTGDTATVTYTLNGCTSKLEAKVGTKKTYIAVFGENSTKVTNIQYKYATEAKSTATMADAKTKTYTGKNQTPSMTLLDAKTKKDVTSSYTITYTIDNKTYNYDKNATKGFVNGGTYNFTAKGKSGTAYDGDIQTAKYIIKAKSMTPKLSAKPAGGTNKKLLKITKVKKNLTSTVTASASKIAKQKKNTTFTFKVKGFATDIKKKQITVSNGAPTLVKGKVTSVKKGVATITVTINKKEVKKKLKASPNLFKKSGKKCNVVIKGISTSNYTYPVKNSKVVTVSVYLKK